MLELMSLPSYPPLFIVLTAGNRSGRIAMFKNLKNPTYANPDLPETKGQGGAKALKEPPVHMAALHSIGPITHYLQFLPHAFPEKLKDSPPHCVYGPRIVLLILFLGIEERPPPPSLGQESKNDCFLNLHAVSGEYDGFTYYRKYAWGHRSVPS